jgi:hypothetical protein
MDGTADSGSSDGTPDTGSVTTGGSYCQECTNDGECGTTGNYCLESGNGQSSFCGTLCTSASECLSGASCLAISGTGLKNCYPTSGSCGQSTGTPDAGTTGGHDAGTSTGHDAGTTTPDAGNPACLKTWSNTYSSFFSNNCFNCHQHSGENESWVISNSTNVISRLRSGSMPPGGGQQAEAPLIQTWINCGHP